MKGDTNLAPTCKWIQFQLSLFSPHTKTNSAAAACLHSLANWSILCNQTKKCFDFDQRLTLSSTWRKLEKKNSYRCSFYCNGCWFFLYLQYGNYYFYTQKTKHKCTCPNTHIHVIPLYIQFLPSVSVCLEVSFIIPLSVDKRKACAPLALSRVLRFSLWQVERFRHYMDPSLPALPSWSVCSMHTQLRMLTLVPLCVCMCMCACVNMHRSCVIFSQGNVSSQRQLPPPLFGNDSLV